MRKIEHMGEYMTIHGLLSLDILVINPKYPPNQGKILNAIQLETHIVGTANEVLRYRLVYLKFIMIFKVHIMGCNI